MNDNLNSKGNFTRLNTTKINTMKKAIITLVLLFVTILAQAKFFCYDMSSRQIAEFETVQEFQESNLPIGIYILCNEEGECVVYRKVN